MDNCSNTATAFFANLSVGGGIAVSVGFICAAVAVLGFFWMLTQTLK